MIFPFFLWSKLRSCGLLAGNGGGHCKKKILESSIDLGNDVGHGEAEPLIIGDSSITVSIHGGEHGLPLVSGQGGEAHSKPEGGSIFSIVSFSLVITVKWL